MESKLSAAVEIMTMVRFAGWLGLALLCIMWAIQGLLLWPYALALLFAIIFYVDVRLTVDNPVWLNLTDPRTFKGRFGPKKENKAPFDQLP